MFDEERAVDPHGECAAEIHRLEALVKKEHSDGLQYHHAWSSVEELLKESQRKLESADRQKDEVIEKCAALAQEIHDLRSHVGSFPFCMEKPCYSAWVAVKQSRRAEKRICEHKEWRTRYGVNGYKECKACGVHFS